MHINETMVVTAKYLEQYSGRCNQDRLAAVTFAIKELALEQTKLIELCNEPFERFNGGIPQRRIIYR